MKEFSRSTKVTSFVKQGKTLKSHRGPDRTEGNTRVVAIICLSWLSTLALVFGKGRFMKKII